MTSLEDAQKKFVELLDSVKASNVAEFLAWIQDSFTTSKPTGETDHGDADAMIRAIANELRSKLPITAIFDSERTLWPEYGLDADCRPETTVHVDAFLYDEDEVDELVDQGTLNRNYCRMCGSHATAPLTFISHSLSIDQLRYLFTAMLPPGTLRGKVLVDVGSRLGAVLYAAHLFSPGAAKLVGIELNVDLCHLQTETVTSFGMSDDVLIVCDDARNRPSELAAADVIVLNNVFEFFLPPQDQLQCWQFLKQNVKSGAVIVSHPAIVNVTKHLPLDFALDDWVNQIPTEQLAAKFAGTNTDLFEDCAKICLYQVK